MRPHGRHGWGEVGRRAGVADDGRIDGAIAEVIATARMRNTKLPVLYYVAPIAAEMAGDALEAVVVSTNSGLRRLVARQWIDASETGELSRLIE